MRYTLEIQKLLNRADQENIHPKDAAKLLVQAIYIADANDDVEMGYDLRSDLLDAEWGLAERPEFVPAFSWMLNAYDADPEQFNAEDLLWKYKWVISELFSNPEVPLTQIEQVLEDYKRRITSLGYGLRSYYIKLFNDALDQEDEEKSRYYLDLVNAQERDDLSDCKACEMDSEVSFYLNKGDFREAWNRAQPLLQKQFTCAHVPLITLCQLCYTAIRDQDTETAASLFAQAEEELEGCEYESSLISSVSRLAVYLFHTDKARGWKFLEKYLSWTRESDASRKFFFSLYLAEAFQLEDQSLEVKLELVPEHPVYQSSGIYRVGELYDFFYRQAKEKAVLFDTRNQNSNFSAQLERALGHD